MLQKSCASLPFLLSHIQNPTRLRTASAHPHTQPPQSEHSDPLSTYDLVVRGVPSEQGLDCGTPPVNVPHLGTEAKPLLWLISSLLHPFLPSSTVFDLRYCSPHPLYLLTRPHLRAFACDNSPAWNAPLPHLCSAFPLSLRSLFQGHLFSAPHSSIMTQAPIPQHPSFPSLHCSLSSLATANIFMHLFAYYLYKYQGSEDICLLCC